MRTFFKVFFACLLALIIFFVIGFFVMVGIAGALASGDKVRIPDASVLVLDLGKNFSEHEQASPFEALSSGVGTTLSDAVRLIEEAGRDSKIKGILIKANGNANGMAANRELREALIRFKASKKFVYAHADVMGQGAYYVASVADSVFLNPAGGMEWNGMEVTLPFLKGTLDRLNIKPQIFYAGKFKSATEIFRVEKMTPENRLQTNDWLGDLYANFLTDIGTSRKIDTATLHNLANQSSIQTTQDAVTYKLVDALRYDDQVRASMKTKLGKKADETFSEVDIDTYGEDNKRSYAGKERIAVIMASGDIVDGNGTRENIGGDAYRAMIRKARYDKSVKAIVLRVNSGGGSALASEQIWRELRMAKTENGKPVVVSFGDVAASGGYYISTGADSIFAQPNTITGSIGVFSIVPDMSEFFSSKLGITFDEVRTSTGAGGLASTRPLTETEKRLIQADVERIYLQFKTRVAEGRKKPLEYIDSIAQGRVYSGSDGLSLGLVDRMGSLDDAIACAARMAKITDYAWKVYPEERGWLESILNKKKMEPEVYLRREMGEDNYRIFTQIRDIKQMTGSVQAKLPFQFQLH